MKFKEILQTTCFMLLLVMIGCTAKSQNPAAQTTAQTSANVMPEFTFYKMDDTPFTKANIESGTKSMVILFDVTCDHCQHEMTAIGERFNDFKNINFYLISFDGKPEIEQFMSTYGKNLKGKSNVTVLQDLDHEFIPKFNPTKYPAMYIYSANKELIKHIDGQTEVDEVLAAVGK